MLVNGKWIDDIFEQESPSGDIDGVNDTFTLSTAPHSSKSVKLYLNGLILAQSQDYTVNGQTITMAEPPQTGQEIYAFYIKG